MKTTVDQVLIALRRIIRAVDLHSRELEQRFGLTGPQLVVLKQLVEEGGVAVSNLARTVHLSHATVTDILGRLERRALVRRARSEQDKRNVLVWPTDAGRDLVERCGPSLQEHLVRRFDGLQDWEQSQILASLQRLVAMMEARDIDAGPMLATGEIAQRKDAQPPGESESIKDAAPVRT